MYTVQDIKSSLEGVLHGTTVNQITNLDALIDRAARQVLTDVDPQETKRIVPITNGVFTNVYDYAVPIDLKGNKVIDLAPQVNRSTWDIWLQAYNQSFDSTKQLSLTDMFTINFNNAIKTIRINAPFLTTPIVVNYASEIQENGTWAVGGNANSLAQDNVNFIGGGSSLSFNLASSGSAGYLENSTMQSVNLTTGLNQGVMFLWTYMQTASNITGVTLQWGSSATDYYQRTVTVTQSNTAFQNGWNLLAFNWNGATTVGTPDVSDITYMRVTWAYDGTAQTAMRLNVISEDLASIMNMEYYSKYLFRDNITGTFQENVTDNSNLINLDTDSFNLLFNQVAYLAVQQQQGIDAPYDNNFFYQQYQQDLAKYKSMYKSETQKPQARYYTPTKGGYNTVFPWFYR